ncbi:MAG TPA: hypothetical protein VNA24_00365 [Hyalangium sp.]|nr:hypothetical protein [Hyalangium sp.]
MAFEGSVERERILATGTLLDDGRVLVAGGSTSTMLSSAELYTP